MIEDALEQILSPEIRKASVRHGNELVLPFRHMREAIDLASRGRIAILGVESFQVMRDGGLLVLDYSGYDFGSTYDDWRAFVAQNNDAAQTFVNEHELGDGYGYILTATSQREFDTLRPSRRAT